MFLASLECLRHVLVEEKKVISVGNILGVSWSASCGQPMFLTRLGIQIFSRTIERLVTGPESVPDA